MLSLINTTRDSWLPSYSSHSKSHDTAVFDCGNVIEAENITLWIQPEQVHTKSAHKQCIQSMHNLSAQNRSCC